MIWRQGDVLIQSVDDLPNNLQKQARPLLAVGAGTGKSHKIKDRRSANTYRGPFATMGELFLEVTDEHADVVHPEHNTIRLPKGSYRVWRQREFTPNGTRVVMD